MLRSRPAHVAYFFFATFFAAGFFAAGFLQAHFAAAFLAGMEFLRLCELRTSTIEIRFVIPRNRFLVSQWTYVIRHLERVGKLLFLSFANFFYSWSIRIDTRHENSHHRKHDSHHDRWQDYGGFGRGNPSGSRRAHRHSYPDALLSERSAGSIGVLHDMRSAGGADIADAPRLCDARRRGNGDRDRDGRGAGTSPSFHATACAEEGGVHRMRELCADEPCHGGIHRTGVAWARCRTAHRTAVGQGRRRDTDPLQGSVRTRLPDGHSQRIVFYLTLPIRVARHVPMMLG